MSGSQSSGKPPLRPFAGSSSSKKVCPTAGPGQKITPARRPLGPNLENLELSFLRVVGRNKIPIAKSEEIQLDYSNRENDTSIQYGATMEVRRGTWKGQRVAIKYIRTTSSSEQDEQSKAKALYDYRKSMFDLNFELQVMSKASLRRHRNIAGLLAVCFDTTSDKNTESSSIPTAHPGLIVGLAHEKYPDLKLFFDRNSNPGRPDRLPFQTSGALIADIADGLTALHNHDLVHADLKPQNVLIFPDSQSLCGIVAKIADFGFLGMVTYSNQGRAPLLDSIPRGGTLDWNAPECLDHPDNFHSGQTMGLSSLLKHPQYQSSRDVYSFGLVSCYIALDGQPPSHFIPNLVQAKLSGETLPIAEARLQDHYSSIDTDDSISIRDLTIKIARNTLNLDRNTRWKSLRNIREMIFGE